MPAALHQIAAAGTFAEASGEQATADPPARCGSMLVESG